MNEVGSSTPEFTPGSRSWIFVVPNPDKTPDCLQLLGLYFDSFSFGTLSHSFFFLIFFVFSLSNIDRMEIIHSSLEHTWDVIRLEIDTMRIRWITQSDSIAGLNRKYSAVGSRRIFILFLLYR